MAHGNDSRPFGLSNRNFDLGVFALALVLRGAFLAVWQWKDVGAAYGQDRYYSLALDWLGWIPSTGMDATHPPFYTMFITAVLWCFRGPSPLPVLALQCLLSSAVCVIMRRLGDRLASPRVGRLAALWVAVDLPMIFFAPQLQTETLFIFMETLFFLRFYQHMGEAREGTAADRTPEFVGRGWALGAFGGLAALCRSAFAAYPPFLILTLAKMRLLNRQRAFLVLFCIGWLSPIAVWTVRNWVRYHRIIPISAQMGWNLYEGFTLDRETVRRHPYEMGEEAKAHGLTDPADIGQYFERKALRFMRDHPVETLRIMAGKALLYWRPWLYDPYTPAQRVFLSLYFFGLFAFALWGIVVNRTAVENWWPIYGLMIYFTATHSAFATFARYRLPLEPFLCLLGAVGIDHALARWDARRNRAEPAQR